MSADPIGVVKRELLVRHLDTWISYAAHRSRRATVVLAPGAADQAADGALLDAALRVFADSADLPRDRRCAVLVLGGADDLAARLGEASAGLPAGVSVHPVPGGIERLPVALRAAGAAGAPVLAYLDAGPGPAPDRDVLAALGGARPAELLLALGPAARSGLAPAPAAAPAPNWERWRGLAEEIGLPLVTEVELVAGDGPEGAGERSELIVFATSAGRRLEAFKDAMWALDEHAGVRYRDPGDPDGHLLNISPDPHPDPLRRELLARLVRVGSDTVTELRLFTTTRTVYRAADTNRALAVLLAAGQVTREPAEGRLNGDVVVSHVGATTTTTTATG